MPKTKVSADRNVRLPKSIFSKYCLKDGDTLTIREVRGSIVLTPVKAERGKRKLNGHSRNYIKQTYASTRELDDERNDWLRLALQGLERAYGDNEPEYTSDIIKEPNPDYEGRQGLVFCLYFREKLSKAQSVKFRQSAINVC